jgi:hypothetical protein
MLVVQASRPHAEAAEAAAPHRTDTPARDRTAALPITCYAPAAARRATIFAPLRLIAVHRHLTYSTCT